MNSVSENQNSEITTILFLLIKYRMQLFISIVVSTLVAVIFVVFVIEVEYYSYSTITIESDNSMQSMLAGKVLGKGISDLGLAGLSGGNEEIDFVLSVLQSKTITDGIVKKYQFKEIYKKDFYFQAAKKLRENTDIIPKDDANMITIGFYDKDSIRAKNVVEDYLISLQQKLNRLAYESDSIKFVYLEKRYLQVIDDLRNSESELTTFQAKNNIMLPEKQIEQTFNALTRLDEELIKLKLTYEFKIATGLDNSEETKLIKKQIQILENSKRNLKDGNTGNYGINLNIGSSLLMEYVRKIRNVKIQTAIMEILLPLYEETKFKSSNQKPRFIIVDPPFVPEYKERPKRLVIVLLITGFSFITHLLIIVFSDKIKRMKNNNDQFYENFISAFKK